MMKNTLLLFFSLSLFIGCNNNSPKDNRVQKVDSPKALSKPAKGFSQQDSIKATGREVLMFLKTENYSELVKYFSSDGVLFSPYGYIDTANCKKLNSEDFLTSINKKWILTWGSYDGSGEPIRLTVTQYLKKFGYNADYLNPEAIGIDEVVKQGNSTNNLKAIFANHHFIDYHFSGFEQKNKGMDWTSLRLVFEKINGEYFVVAIIHDQWTV